MKPHIRRVGQCYRNRFGGWNVIGWWMNDVPTPYLTPEGYSLPWTFKELEQIATLNGTNPSWYRPN